MNEDESIPSSIIESYTYNIYYNNSYVELSVEIQNKHETHMITNNILSIQSSYLNQMSQLPMNLCINMMIS